MCITYMCAQHRRCPPHRMSCGCLRLSTRRATADEGPPAAEGPAEVEHWNGPGELKGELKGRQLMLMGQKWAGPGARAEGGVVRRGKADFICLHMVLLHTKVSFQGKCSQMHQ